MNRKKKELPYSTDGMVFCVDGILGVDSDGNIKEIVNNVVLGTNGSTYIRLTNGWNFSAVVPYPDYLIPTLNAYTIEVVALYRPVAGRYWVYIANPQFALSAYYSSGGAIQNALLSSTHAWTKLAAYNYPTLCIQMTSDNMLDIGGGMTGPSSEWGYPQNVCTIGYPYSGRNAIYAIRVYNRILTSSELQQNRNLDRERFNLEI